MKQVLIINADIDKTPATQALIDAYRNGAQQAQAIVKDFAIADLIFNPNKQFNNRSIELEHDLEEAVNAIKQASHLVIFCSVYKNSIPTKIKGFFDRIFMPEQVFDGINKFGGKSARVVSLLDEAAWHDWQMNQKPTYLPIKKYALETRQIKPVRTSTIGYLQSLDNEYSQKWMHKLYAFGLKLS
ncbi:NAD(P)H-dependent oxidoreductase [Mucilaginibacter sp.]